MASVGLFFVARTTKERPHFGIKNRVIFDAEAGLFLKDTGTGYVAYTLGVGEVDQSLLALADLGERDYSSLTNVSIPEADLQVPTANALGARRVGHWTYSFAVNGGGQGTIAMTGAPIPDKAIVTWGAIYVKTVPVGVGANIAIQIEAANDFVTAAAISGAPWSTLAAAKNAIPVPQTASLWVKTTAARTPSLVLTTADLTAGIIEAWAEYVVHA